MKHAFFFIAVLFLASPACGTDEPATPADGAEDPVVVDEHTWDIPTEDVNPEVLGNVTGTVFSPSKLAQYRFPIPKALVYVDRTAPGMIPRRNYCDKCIDLDPATPYDMSDSYGTFRINGIAAGEWNLVVQKGQFRRVRRITVRAGETIEIPSDMTTLPSSSVEDGTDTIPRIAVASGSYDWIEDLLAKFGLADLNSQYHFIRGTQEFTLLYNGGRAYGTGIEDFKDFLRRPLETADQDDLMDFNILFIPCTDGRFADEVLGEDEVLNNLRQFVVEGGKLYVSDWSYDFVERVFPEFIDFFGDDAVIGSAEDVIGDFWDTTGSIGDADLSSWLAALGLTPNEILFEKSWVGVESTAVVPGENEEGELVDIEPAEVILGTAPGHGLKPLSIVFNYGCGKVLFTTYHTIGALISGTRPEIIPQEKILLYLILDISVCSESVVIPI